MLSLSRTVGESIVCQVGDEQFSLKVTRVCGRRVQIAFDAPPDVRILRDEVLRRELKRREKDAAA